jgi:chitin disaccharide deacetylase
MSASGSDMQLLVRGDDMGMTHACNLAITQCFRNGILRNAAIQAVAPWAEEACALGRENPGWCLGVHLTTIGEWQGYRWRPVLPYNEVPSLVDDNGFLPRSPSELFGPEPDYDQLEREFRAQVELIIRWGITPGYVDTHYIEGAKYVEYNAVVDRIADDLGVPRSGYAGEKRIGSIYAVEPAEKEETLATALERMEPGLYLSVHHLLVDAPDSHALVHMAVDARMSPGVAAHRIAECETLTSARIGEIIERRGIELLSYRDLR